jgi:uncharacterized membrane protein YkvA (DUF1232 family)
MPLTVSFQLSDSDLEYFSARMNEAKAKASRLGEGAVLQSAERMLAGVREKSMPGFVRERFEKFDLLVRMANDKAWNLSGPDRDRIVNAIAYVCDPQDLIPDHIPGIGLLDDAIMIEVVSTDLNHDVEAYQDFCKYRDNEVARRGAAGKDLSQETWVVARRTQLHERMRRRRASLWAARLGRSPF